MSDSKNAQAAGRSAPGVFRRSETFNFQLMRWLSQAPYGTAERLHFNGSGGSGLRRGYNVLCFEGPGQSGACMLDNSGRTAMTTRLPSPRSSLRGEQPDVDPDRIAAIGCSMGGYFVPRGAAFDRRIAAYVADCLLPAA